MIDVSDHEIGSHKIIPLRFTIYTKYNFAWHGFVATPNWLFCQPIHFLLTVIGFTVFGMSDLTHASELSDRFPQPRPRPPPAPHPCDWVTPLTPSHVTSHPLHDAPVTLILPLLCVWEVYQGWHPMPAPSVTSLCPLLVTSAQMSVYTGHRWAAHFHLAQTQLSAREGVKLVLVLTGMEVPSQSQASRH